MSDGRVPPGAPADAEPDKPAARRHLFGLAGVLALAAAALAYWFRWHQRHEWLVTVVADQCRHVPPLPHVGIVTSVGIVFCLVAGASFIVYLQRCGLLTGALAGVLLIGALLGAAGGTLVLADTPTKTSDGLDGSGLPCPEG